MSKKILIGSMVLVAVFIATVFYSLGRFSVNNSASEVKIVKEDVKEEPEVVVVKKDPITELVSAITKETGVNLVLVGPTDFEWYLNKSNFSIMTKVSGVLFTASEVKHSDYDKVESYMNNWTTDIYNLADGVSGGLRGYIINDQVCALRYSVAELRSDVVGHPEPINDKVEVKLSCGKLNPETVAQSVLEQQVQITLAQKYKKDLVDVNVAVNKQDQNHAVGMVNFGQGVNVEGGLFLAVKNNDIWVVVFDGNGSVDCLKMKDTYNFSTSLLQGICD